MRSMEMNKPIVSDPGRAPVQILIVDDEPVIVDELLEFFADENIAAIAAADVPAALQAFQQAPPGAITVILTDVKMPGQDGLSFAQGLLGIVPETAAVEIIVMTGHGSFGMAVDALRSRVFDFLRKPVKLAELAQSVGRAHEAALLRRARARVAEERMARLRDMTVALDERARQLTAHVKSAPGLKGSDVLSVISEELRNPLVPVVGLSELIEENAASLTTDQLVEYAGMIRLAGWRLTNLVDALVLATAHAGGEPAAPQPSERVSDIVAALLMGHGADARRHGQMLKISAPDNVSVLADRVCLMLALDQLVGSAIRRGGHGQSVHIDAEVVGSEVAFHVIGGAVVRSASSHPPLDGAPPDGLGGNVASFRLADRLAMVLGGRLEVRDLADDGAVASIFLPMGPAPARR